MASRVWHSNANARKQISYDKNELFSTVKVSSTADSTIFQQSNPRHE